MKQTSLPVSRRNFIRIAGAATAGFAALTQHSLAAAVTDSNAPAATGPAAPGKKYPIGLELYSVRDELSRDLPRTLRTVAQQGYEVVEFYAPYCDWQFPYAKEVRRQLDDLGLRCYSTHNNFTSFTPGPAMSHAIELNQILGSRYVILASEPGGLSGEESWKSFCAQLADAAETLRPHGLAVGFHNHGTEWQPLTSSQRIMDFIAANTPADFVLQLDVGTCVAAGADPVAWIKANPGRIKIAHLKDWAPGDAAQEKAYRVLFGEGVCPWREIIAALESVGQVEFYLLEQEGSRYSEFETAQRCLANWQAFRAGL